MKILYYIAYPDGYGDDRFIYDGFRHAFESIGHEVIALTERDDFEKKLTETKPDIFITTMNVRGFDFTTAAPIIKKHREQGMLVFMRAGDVRDATRYGWFINLAKQDMLADAYYSEGDFTKEFFEDIIGKPLRFLALAADKTIHFPTVPSKKYECDIIYIGANLPLKQELFRRRLYPLMKKYRVKVFGGDWDALDKYFLHPLAKIDRMFNLGGVFARWRISRQVPIDEENVAYSSAKIALNFHEQNKTIGPNARIFKVPACGGFEVCDPLPHLRDYFTESEMVAPATDEEFFKTIEYYLTHESERKAMQERATARAQRDHTWNNRVTTMLDWYRELKNG